VLGMLRINKGLDDTMISVVGISSASGRDGGRDSRLLALRRRRSKCI
jgi:hypothetical protein